MSRGISKEHKQELIDNLIKRFKGHRVNRAQIKDVAEEMGIEFTQTAFLRTASARAERGIYLLPGSKTVIAKEVSVEDAEEVSIPKKKSIKKTPTKTSPIDVGDDVVNRVDAVQVGDLENYVPDKVPHYVKFGNYNKIKKVLESKKFFPLFITGLTGNGKTLMPIHMCAEMKRELVRVNITSETDEDDLLGGFRLLNGETVYHMGPVVEAMMRGAVLLLDEMDLGTNKLLCLQPILEGRGIYLKKINRYINHAPGFTIVATGNTKGKGSDDGQYIGTNIMNEAFLDRFVLTFEQEYPSPTVETKIIKKILDAQGTPDDTFANNLALWASAVREGYRNGACEALIATRRLVSIAETYGIFGDRFESIEYCISRFNQEDRDAMLEFYEKSTADERVVKDEHGNPIEPDIIPDELLRTFSNTSDQAHTPVPSAFPPVPGGPSPAAEPYISYTGPPIDKTKDMYVPNSPTAGMGDNNWELVKEETKFLEKNVPAGLSWRAGSGVPAVVVEKTNEELDKEEVPF